MRKVADVTVPGRQRARTRNVMYAQWKRKGKKRKRKSCPMWVLVGNGWTRASAAMSLKSKGHQYGRGKSTSARLPARSGQLWGDAKPQVRHPLRVWAPSSTNDDHTLQQHKTNGIGREREGERKEAMPQKEKVSIKTNPGRKNVSACGRDGWRRASLPPNTTLRPFVIRPPSQAKPTTTSN